MSSKTTKYTLPFKKIRGKANTSNTIPVFSEDISSQISIDVGEILGEKIPADPQQAVSEGTVEYVELDLQEIIASNGLSFNLQFPSTYNGHFGTGVQGENVRNHTQVVKQSKNDSKKAKPDHSGGYVYELKDKNGNPVPVGASENWSVDPFAGIVTSEEEVTEIKNGGTLSVYIYTGQTLEKVLSGLNPEVQDDETLISPTVSVINFSDGLSVQKDADGEVSISADYENATTDDIEEGDDNLYYTNDRVDNRISQKRPSNQATFSGDGQTETFVISHGNGTKPKSWILTPATDDASSFSHVEADDTNLYVKYDTPPPAGSENMVINWMITNF